MENCEKGIIEKCIHLEHKVFLGSGARKLIINSTGNQVRRF